MLGVMHVLKIQQWKGATGPLGPYFHLVVLDHTQPLDRDYRNVVNIVKFWLVLGPALLRHDDKM